MHALQENLRQGMAFTPNAKFGRDVPAAFVAARSYGRGREASDFAPGDRLDELLIPKRQARTQHFTPPPMVLHHRHTILYAR